MAITIKKKTLKVRTGAREEQAEDMSDAVAEEEQEPTVDTPVVLHPVASAPVKGTSYTLDAILALLAVLLFGGLLMLQALELNYYKMPPSAWVSSM